MVQQLWNIICNNWTRLLTSTITSIHFRFPHILNIQRGVLNVNGIRMSLVHYFVQYKTVQRSMQLFCWYCVFFNYFHFIINTLNLVKVILLQKRDRQVENHKLSWRLGFEPRVTKLRGWCFTRHRNCVWFGIERCFSHGSSATNVQHTIFCMPNTATYIGYNLLKE